MQLLEGTNDLCLPPVCVLVEDLCSGRGPRVGLRPITLCQDRTSPVEVCKDDLGGVSVNG